MHPGRDESLDLPLVIVIDVEHLRPQYEVEESALAVFAQLTAEVIEAIVARVAKSPGLVEVLHQAARKVEAAQLLSLFTGDAEVTHHSWLNATLEATQGICLAWTM